MLTINPPVWMQDVGRLLGLTNTGGTVVGVICNLLTGEFRIRILKPEFAA